MNDHLNPTSHQADKLVLVTGGAGFIGSHLVDSLLGEGYSVRVLDNFSTGRLDNLPDQHAGLEIIHGDVADFETVLRSMRDCTHVVHLAAVASVQASVDNPVATHQANFIGTLNVCEAMAVHTIRRVIFASSASVYGPNGQDKAINESTPTQPLTPYAADKLSSEHYLDFYRRNKNLDPIIFRFFNIFGPRQDPSSPYSGVISIFSERALAGKNLTIYGDGEQTRDFVYIADLVDLLTWSLEAASINEPTNVGLGFSTSLNDLVRIIENHTGHPVPVEYTAARAGDIRHSLSDNGKLLGHGKLGNPTSVATGLTKLLTSMRPD